MRLFLLVIISAALGLIASILLYEMYKINIPPLFIQLPITGAGYLLFKHKLDDV